MPGLKFNTASQNITFALINATNGSFLSASTVSCFVSLDGAAQVSGGGTVTYLGNGQYNYAPTQGETSATAASFLFSATSAVIENLMFLTDKVDGGGLVKVDVEDYNGTAVSVPATAGIPDVNVKNWNNHAAQSDVNNLPKVDVEDIVGAAVSTTTAQLGVNVVKYNNQTAQTDANNLPKVDIEDIVGAAVNTAAAQLGVNLVNIAGVAVSTSTAQLGVNVVSVAGAASNIKKNQALSNFGFLMTDSTNHKPVTGLTVTATRSIDGTGFSSCANSVTEISAGWYKINLAATDLNGNVILLRFTATGADDRDIEIITQP